MSISACPASQIRILLKNETFWPKDKLNLAEDTMPSLKGLQAFEAAARTGSFVRAAEELSVSPAAISQLVRALEDAVGRKLFHRVNRGVTLTEAGLEVAPRVAAAFEELRGVGRHLSGQGPRARLVISTPLSIATGWLPSRVSDFIQTHGAYDVSIRGEEDPAPIDKDLIDLRMSYGRFPYRDHEPEEIGRDWVYAVCAPDHLAPGPEIARPEDLCGGRLIHTDWGPTAAGFPSWRMWFEEAGVDQDPRIGRGLVANSSRAALDLAINGLGVTLCQGLLVAEPLRAGWLVLASSGRLPLAQSYCLTIPRRSAQRPIVRAFAEWFSEECRTAISNAARMADELSDPPADR
jgi:LysR family glycine cleavage system transcriptional activator